MTITECAPIKQRETRPYTMRVFYEFFAGGGMARAGLGQGWSCIFANDYDHKKSRAYIDNWGGEELRTQDVGTLKISDIPGRANLVWASFPCQDLSLAGGGAGLKGERSGTFHPFWNLMTSLVIDCRAPDIIVLENVCGTLTSHDGRDFSTICGNFRSAGYSVGAIVVDAALFVPQSRPRLFVIGVRADIEIPSDLTSDGPVSPWHTRALTIAHDRLPPVEKLHWVWWAPPIPSTRTSTFSDVIESDPPDVEWFSTEDTARLLAMMSELNKAKLTEAKRAGRRIVGGLYKRTRRDVSGGKVQRAEIRFDDIAGCLRTPAGGSSRQLILVVDGESVKARLISGRETARLMGLPEDYKLPSNYNEAYHLTGDGVVVPVVRHLAVHILEPILENLPERAKVTK